MKWSRTEGLAFSAWGVFALSALPLIAQEKPPVDEAGSQVATQQTPAAATNSDELRIESQNPSLFFSWAGKGHRLSEHVAICQALDPVRPNGLSTHSFLIEDDDHRVCGSTHSVDLTRMTGAHRVLEASRSLCDN